MKKKILIINENEEDAKSIKERLTSSSSDIYCASTIFEALHYFVKHEFCLIILDAGMSAEDDHKLLRAMRNAKSTPIMVLSILNVCMHFKRERTHILGIRILTMNVWRRLMR